MKAIVRRSMKYENLVNFDEPISHMLAVKYQNILR